MSARAEALLARARELQPHLREQRRQTAASGAHSEQTDALLRDAGFYRALVPARCGGLGLDLAAFLRTVVELAHGCPGTAWCAGSLAGTALQVASRFGEREQAEVFATGDARCMAIGHPAALAARAGSGWVIDAASRVCAGARLATHCLGEARSAEGPLVFIAERASFELAEADAAGLAGAGSQAISLAQVPLEERFARPGAAEVSVQQAVLAAVFVGAALAALERYEDLVRDGADALDADTQRWLGAGIGRTTAAELLLLETAEQYEAACPPGALRAREDDLRLAMMAREAMRLAWGAVAEIARTAAADRGDFEQIARDLLGGWGEPSIGPEEILVRELARARLRVEA